MQNGLRKSYRVNIFCAFLILALLLAVPACTAWTSVHADRESSAQAVNGTMPSSPEDAHQRIVDREVPWPDEDGNLRSADTVDRGVRVSIPFDTVSGTTSHASSAVKIELFDSVSTLKQTVNTTTDGNRLFRADLSTGNIVSGDKVKITDMVGGASVEVLCTLTAGINTSTDKVGGTALAGRTIDVYIIIPSTYFADVTPGAAHATASGATWTASFSGALNLRTGDAAYIYATDGNGNIVMNSAATGGSLVVYPQYNEVLGFYNPGVALNVNAGNTVMTVGTDGSGFFEAMFTTHSIAVNEAVSCKFGATTRSINASDVTAIYRTSTNHVTGNGPANKEIRVTMNPYGAPRVFQSTINSQGAYDVDLGTYKPSGTEIISVAWYDADGDCVVEEFQPYCWYLAEGYTGLTPGGGSFDTYVLLQNPTGSDAAVNMIFQVQNGSAAPKEVLVPANSRVTVHLDEVPGLTEASVSTQVLSMNGVTINAERAMYFSYEGLLGGHDSIGTQIPSKVWYLAEGYTGLTPGGGGFATWVLVQNPSTQDANITMSFQLDSGTADNFTFLLPAGTRQSVKLNDVPGLKEKSVSTKVTSDVPVVCERAEYFSYEGKNGGHDSIAVPNPEKTWYLAEGYTGLTPGGGGFDTWVLVQNPNTETANVTMSFQLESGTAADKKLSLAGGTRQQVRLNDLPGLSGVNVSTKVTSDIPVVAERAMYFSYEGKMGGHNSCGVSAPAAGWCLPEGYTGTGFDTWVLIQNPGTANATVTLKFQLPTGKTAADQVYTVNAGTRKTVHLNELPGLSDTDVSTTITSTVPVIVERAEYFTYYGKDGGHDSCGIPF